MQQFKCKSDVVITSYRDLSEDEILRAKLELEIHLNSMKKIHLPITKDNILVRFHFKEE